MKLLLHICVLLCCLMAVPAWAAETGDLEIGFRDPPHSAGIRGFWWWLNSNVTKEAITRDLEQMKDKGFNGALIFDADGSSQRGNRKVPAGPAFGSPEWTGLFVHACREAERLDLELSLNIQSGWNLGGPRVTAEEATQTLVWSRTEVKGPATFEQVLPAPRSRDFYKDVAVVAVPMPSKPVDATGEQIRCSLQASSSQNEFPCAMAMDGDPKTFWVSDEGPEKDQPQWLLLTLSESTKISELSLQGRAGYAPRECTIQVSLDNKAFHTVRETSLEDGELLRASFEPQQAKYIRLLFADAYDVNPVEGRPRNVQVTEIALPGVGVPAMSTFRPIKDLHLKSATRELGMSAPDCRFLLNTDAELPGELAVKRSDILTLSDKMDDQGRLCWDAPEGQWIILRIGHTATGAHVSTQSAGWDGRVLDYMNPDSLDAYWNRNIEPLFRAIGPLAGTALRYVHTDSWEGGGMNWTPGFDRTFRANRGYDPLPWLAVLAGYVVDSREESNAFLADFRKTIGDRVADHYGHLAALAGKHGMATHPECSGPHAGPLDGLKNYGCSELMMSEFWSPSPHRPDPQNRFFVKPASSAAHTYGKRLVGAEGFTTIGPHWNDVPWSAMKPSFDHEYCAGLNLLFTHTFTCSPKEMGTPGQEYFAGTHFNPQVTWWDEAPAVIDYFRRCQYLAQQGDFVADVIYYYGDHIPNIATLKESDPAGALPGFDYDVLSEELLLSSLTVENGRFALPSGMEYRVLVLPDHRVLSLGALKKIDELVRAGGTVLGAKPLRAVSLEGGAEGKALFQELADGLWGPSELAANAKRTARRLWRGLPTLPLVVTAGLQSFDRQRVSLAAGDLRSAAWSGQETGPQQVGAEWSGQETGPQQVGAEWSGQETGPQQRWGPQQRDQETEPQQRNVGNGRVAWGMAARDLLQADGVAPDVTFRDENVASAIQWIHYRIDDADVYFLSESQGKAVSADAIFRCHSRVPELWDAVDGSTRKATTFTSVDGCTQVPLEFDPYGSMFVVFQKASSGDRSDGPNFPTWQQTQSIAGPWDVTFDARWGGPEQPVRFDTLTSWTDHSDPGIKYYSGKAVYRTTFTIDHDSAGQRFAVELGQVKDVGIARVTLNGTNLGVAWRPPFRVDVTEAVVHGENKLAVEVVNSWRNRLIGDRELPDGSGRRLTRTNISVTKDWKLEASGLLGPVELSRGVATEYSQGRQPLESVHR